MSIKNLSQRLERLESRLLPDTGEPMMLTVCFVSPDHRVVDQMQFTMPGVPNKGRGRRRQRPA